MLDAFIIDRVRRWREERWRRREQPALEIPALPPDRNHPTCNDDGKSGSGVLIIAPDDDDEATA